MISIPKVVGVMFCGLLLCLGLSNAAQADNMPSASDVMKTNKLTDRTGFQADENELRKNAKATKTIKGELLRVEGENYFVKGHDGKEIRLHTDKTTQDMRGIKQGDRIEAKVTDRNHALSMRSIREPDADHEDEGGRDLHHPTDALTSTNQAKTVQWGSSTCLSGRMQVATSSGSSLLSLHVTP